MPLLLLFTVQEGSITYLVATELAMKECDFYLQNEFIYEHWEK